MTQEFDEIIRKLNRKTVEKGKLCIAFLLFSAVFMLIGIWVALAVTLVLTVKFFVDCVRYQLRVFADTHIRSLIAVIDLATVAEIFSQIEREKMLKQLYNKIYGSTMMP